MHSLKAWLKENLFKIQGTTVQNRGRKVLAVDVSAAWHSPIDFLVFMMLIFFRLLFMCHLLDGSFFIIYIILMISLLGLEFVAVFNKNQNSRKNYN
jgi:uncharacterized RDD family membrane protein YckC